VEGLLVIGAAVALAAGAMVLARLALHVVGVHGDSMTPTFHDGDQLLVLRRWFRRRLRVGDVVVCLPPPGVVITDAATQLIVKRVAAMPDGRFHVLGDAPRHSLDSRSFGPLTPDLVRGRVLRRLRSSPPGGERVGPVARPGTG
jgi:nickel-type superoxide dismutase maturation protease